MFLKEILSENEPKFIKGVLLKAIRETLNTPMLDLGSPEVPFVIGFNPIENCDTILLYQNDEIMGFINYNPDADIGEIRPNATVNDAINSFPSFALFRNNPDAAQSHLKFNLMLKKLGLCFEKEMVNHLDLPILMETKSSVPELKLVVYVNLCIRNKSECFCEDLRCWGDVFYPRLDTETPTLKEFLETIRYYLPIRTCTVPILKPYGTGVKLTNITPDDIARWLENGRISEAEFNMLTRALASLPLGTNQVWCCHNGLYTERIDDELNLHNIDDAIDEYIQRHHESLHNDMIDRIVHVTYNLCGLRLKSYKVYG